MPTRRQLYANFPPLFGTDFLAVSGMQNEYKTKRIQREDSANPLGSKLGGLLYKLTLAVHKFVTHF